MPVHRRRKNNLVWPEMKQTEEFLAAECNKVTMEERAQALDDIHCVGRALEEVPETRARLLNEFDILVQYERNPIYEIAINQNRAYVEDPSFRLRFLRCNMYDVHRSVRQMMRFLQHKATYFGEVKVAHDIIIDDLNDDDIKLLSSGLYHIQEERDQNGRVVLYLMNQILGKSSVDTMIKVAYYIFNNVLIPIPEVQSKGFVGVYYDVTKPEENLEMPGFTFLVTLMDVVASIPLRHSAVHICLKPIRSSLVLSNTLLFYTLNQSPADTRIRTRIHYGTDAELQLALRSHGIHTQRCPVDLEGNIRRDVSNTWFQKQEKTADTRHNPQLVVLNQPRPQDVLFGKGYGIQHHLGNFWFRNYLMSHRDAYDSAPQSLRTEISTKLARTMFENGTRFLKRAESGEWMEVDLHEATKKVGQLFRTFRKKA
ncbi:unnamed protein product [Cylindrotheca closterium]|uniref:DUF6824 domain-containing protein n=1 Tax=Cylindrotheca closterium TaxID=2856 RepID=A0AAD2GCB1_9STRA|nr:unnamed protein product [Cylindrotheca closterium]